MKIRHVVNVVGASARFDLLEAQDLTLTSMRTALRATSPDIEVEVVGVRFSDEEAPVDWITDGSPLQRSVLELGSFEQPRRLPILGDILESFADEDFDLGVFTNIDIVVQPLFYELLSELHGMGHDAFTINRRTVEPRNAGNGMAWLASQTGSAHPGHDCFAFTPEVISAVDVGDVCVGVPLVGRALLFNVMLKAKSFRQFIDLNATFHVGNDQQWTGATFDDYTEHNYVALLRVITNLVDIYGEPAVLKLPKAAKFLSAATSDSPPPWRPNKPDPRRDFTPRSMDQRRLIFAASPGRSGTEFLARLLGTAANVDSCHEGAPDMSGRHLRSIAYGNSTNSYESRKEKTDELHRSLAKLPNGGVLVHTTHMFVKTFADVVLDEFNHDLITVIDIHRPLTDLVTSMIALGWFTAYGPAWRDWLIPPTAPGSKFRLDANDITGRTDLALGYILDSAIRTRALRSTTPNVRWVDLTIADLRTEDDVIKLFKRLQLRTTPATWEVAFTPVNERKKLMAQRRIAMSRHKVEAGVESFAQRFESQIIAAGVEYMFEKTP